MIRRAFATTLVASTLALGGTAATAAIKVYDANAMLSGISGVMVGGVSYDVQFLSGLSCVQAFSGCDERTDFDFPNLTDARLASSALLDVLSREDFANAGTVYLYTPYQPGVLFGAAWVFLTRDSTTFAEEELVYSSSLVNLRNSYLAVTTPSMDTARYFADWSRSPVAATSSFAGMTAAPTLTAAVPEPSSYALMAAGIGALGFVARRRRTA